MPPTPDSCLIYGREKGTKKIGGEKRVQERLKDIKQEGRKRQEPACTWRQREKCGIMTWSRVRRDDQSPVTDLSKAFGQNPEKIEKLIHPQPKTQTKALIEKT